MLSSDWFGGLRSGLRQSIWGGVRPRRQLRDSFSNLSSTLEARVLPAATPIGNTIPVNSPPDGDVNTTTSEGQSIAVDAAGNFVVVWQQESSDGFDVMARRFHADGTPIGAAFLVNITSAVDQREPTVAMNATGEFVIAWQSGNDGPRRDIFARRFDAEGVAEGGEFRVHADVDALRLNPEVAIDDDGAVAITFARYGDLSGDIDLFVRRYDADGVPLGNEVEVVSNQNQNRPDIAFTPDGGLLLVWPHQYELHALRFDADGDQVGDLLTFGTYRSDSPSVAVDSEGGFIVTWYGGTIYSGSQQHIFAQQFNSDGIPRGDEFIVNSNPTVNNEWFSSVAIATDGNFVISWTGENPNRSYQDVYARTFKSDGQPLGETFRVNPATALVGDQRFGHVAMTPTGEFVIDWTDGPDGEVFARRYVLNAIPSDVVLSPDNVAENAPIGTVVGILSSTDADVEDAFTYELVSGVGDDDNNAFQVVGNELRTAALLDYEATATLSIRVRATDLAGATFEKILTIDVTNVAELQIVTLSNDSVDENRPGNTLVGEFGLTDSSEGSVRYRLVRGEGDDGNAGFRISGNRLLTKASFDAERQSSYSIRVQAKDPNGNVTFRVFTIEINDVNDAPERLRLSPRIVRRGESAGSTVGRLSAFDADAGASLTYSLVSGRGDSGNDQFAIDGDSLMTTVPLNGRGRSVSIRVRVTDEEGAWIERIFRIKVRRHRAD